MFFRTFAILGTVLLAQIFSVSAHAQAAIDDRDRCRGISCILKGGGISIVLKPAVKKPRVKPKQKVVKRPKTKTKKRIRKAKRPTVVKRKKVRIKRASVQPAPVLPLGPSWEGLEERLVITLTQSELDPLPSTFMVRFDPNILLAQGIELATVSPTVLATFLGLQPFQIRSIQRRFLPGAIINISDVDQATVALNPAVIRLTQNTVIKPASQKRPRLSWGLDRIDQAQLPLDGKFQRKNRSGVLRVYLLDSGVDRRHPQFNDRVVFGASFVPVVPASASMFCKLHGTEMASLIMGETLGVASDIRLIDVTVLPCLPEETGSAAALIEGLYWVAEREEALRPRKLSVVNLSLTGPKSQDVNDWVDALSKLGIAVVAAAGNQGEDACLFSPASAETAITVGALNHKDKITDFSNTGACVKMSAPGFKVSAASAANHDVHIASSGTSAATAYVSGILASNLTDVKEGRGFNLLSSNAVNLKGKEDALLLAQTRSEIRADCRVSQSVKLLNLRSKPKTNAEILQKLPSGTLVEVVAHEQGWANIRIANGGAGWAAVQANGKVLLTERIGQSVCR